MLVSTDGMSKPRHQQLLQSLPVNFCGPMVCSNKLLDHGSNHILILLDFLHPPVTCQSEFDTSSKADVYPRPFTWRTALPSGQDVNICWNSVGILLVIPTGDSH